MAHQSKPLTNRASPPVRRNPVAPWAWRAKGGQHADHRFSPKQKRCWQKAMWALE